MAAFASLEQPSDDGSQAIGCRVHCHVSVSATLRNDDSPDRYDFHLDDALFVAAAASRTDASKPERYRTDSFRKPVQRKTQPALNVELKSIREFESTTADVDMHWL